MLDICIKSYSELTKNELYALLQLRSEVFVVEQNCVYQDIDYKDQKSLHILGYLEEKLVAYTRIFKPGDYFEDASIGRVVVNETSRHLKLGSEIMIASIDAVNTYFNTSKIHISAQCYLLNFYRNLGFEPFGNEYLEDDIPHIGMLYGT